MKNQVILVSLDGLPAHTFRQAWNGGDCDLYAYELETVYPSITLPAHVSVLTGRRPDEHGVMENIVLDTKEYQRIPLYCPSKEDAAGAIKEDTIIHKFVRQGLSCKTINWPLGEGLPGENQSEHLSVHEDVKSVEEAYQKDQRALKSLKEEMYREEKDFLAVHFEEYDGAAHMFGIESRRAKDALSHMAAYVTDIVKHAKICAVENIIFFSDHGMIAKKESFFPNIYISGCGYKKELQEKQILFLSDGSGCALFYSRLPVEKNEEILMCMLKSNKVREIARIEETKGGLLKPFAVLEMYPGICSEDITEEADEKYEDMKGLHGYNPKYVREMNGVFLAFDPKGRIEISKNELCITDIANIIIKLMERKGRKYESTN